MDRLARATCIAALSACCCAMAACSTLADQERDDRQCRAQSLPNPATTSLPSSYDRCMEIKGHPRFHN